MKSGMDWTPVINNNWKHNGGNKLTTLFVDNLPDDSSSIWVRNLFSKFGRVRDLFIPKKKSRITGLRFGFVRYARRDEANTAIAKVNGSWIWGNKIIVKIARFEANNGDLRGNYMTVAANKKRKNQDREMDVQPPGYHNVSGQRDATKGKNGMYLWGNRRRIEEGWRKKHSNIKKIWRKKQELNPKTSQDKSYLEALKGNSWRKPKQPIHLKELGNEWLSRSAIAKLSPVRSMALVQEQLRSLGYVDIQVRVMGGDSIILTFSSSEVRDSLFNGGHMAWLKEWFLEIYKWEESTIKPRSCRLIWLNCYGIPIQLWNVHNFIKIGQYWGDVIQVSEDTVKEMSFAVGKILVSTSIMDGINEVVEVECKGNIYRIRVMEEQLVVHTFLKSDFCCQGCAMLIPSSSNNEEEKKDKNVMIAANEKKVEEYVNVNWGKDVGTNQVDLVENSDEAKDEQSRVMDSCDLEDSIETKDGLSRVEDSGDFNDHQVEENAINVTPEPINNTCRQLVIANSTPINSVGFINSAMGVGRVDMNRLHPQLVMCQQLESSLRENRVHIQKALPIHSSNEESSWSVTAFNKELLKNKGRTSSNSKVKKAAKVKRKRKTIEEILGIPPAGHSNISGKGGKKNKQKKSIVFRAAIAEAALSISSEGINNRNKILLNEAEAVLTVTKILGEDYAGDDAEVISRIMHMEDQDEGRAVQLNEDLLIA